VNDQETEKSALCSKSGSKLPIGSKEEEKKIPSNSAKTMTNLKLRNIDQPTLDL
jgi:hypothetical protein